MTPRFYVPSPLPPAGACAVTGEAAHRIGRVPRMRPGETVHLFDPTGREAEVVIGQVRGAEVTVALTEDLAPAPAEPRLHLYQALIRPSRYEWLLEKATELGAASLTPVITARVQVRPAELGRAKAARWDRIIIEAAEQCGRRTLPHLGGPVTLAGALRDAPGLLVLPWEEERGRAASLGESLRRLGAIPDELSLFIGPEGGFGADEIAAARRWCTRRLTRTAGAARGDGGGARHRGGCVALVMRDRAGSFVPVRVHRLRSLVRRGFVWWVSLNPPPRSTDPLPGSNPA